MTNFIKIINKIEKIRQEIFDVTRENAALDYFLDKISYGTPEEYQKASKDYKENRKRIDYLSKKLSKIIKELKLENVELIQKWVKIHIETCTEIICSSENQTPEKVEQDSTKVFVAKETIVKWKRVLTTKSNFVIPNISYLSDYNIWFEKLLNQYIDNQKDDSPNKM
jgi:hypothetical protein